MLSPLVMQGVFPRLTGFCFQLAPDAPVPRHEILPRCLSSGFHADRPVGPRSELEKNEGKNETKCEQQHVSASKKRGTNSRGGGAYLCVSAAADHYPRITPRTILLSFISYTILHRKSSQENPSKKPYNMAFLMGLWSLVLKKRSPVRKSESGATR